MCVCVAIVFVVTHLQYTCIINFCIFSKLHTFMVMYKTHCQRILDSVVRANFVEVSMRGREQTRNTLTHVHVIVLTNVTDSV